ncbi:glycosyltransferase family 2 protein [Larkinella harenae]
MLSFLEYVAYAIYGFTALNVLYIFLYALAGNIPLRKRDKREPETTHFRKMLLLLPAYREDAVIIDSARNCLQQTYPTDLFDVAVIADSLQPHTMDQLRSMRVTVIDVSFEVSTKVKSLMAALNQFTQTDYEVAVILDADNHLATDFLTRINQAFDKGWRVVQGHRVAKNTNTSVAILDAVSEEVNNHLFRKGHRVLGLSSGLIGSGMAFEYDLLKALLAPSTAVSGFDKELELRILKQRIRIEYLENAYIYDEKVQNGAVFEHQRTRWIAAQFRHLRLSWASGIRGLLMGNVDYADKVFQTLLIPRVLLLGMLSASLLLALVGQLFPWAGFIGGQLLVLLVSLYLAIPSSLKRQVGLAELLKLPGLIIRYMRAILNYKKARRRFLHTPHTTAMVDAKANS